MFEGIVISINIAAAAAAPMQSVNEVRAVPGKGLEGDRYFDNKGTFSKPLPDRELTLIEAEAVEAMKRELDVDYGLGDSRRNSQSEHSEGRLKRVAGQEKSNRYERGRDDQR